MQTIIKELKAVMASEYIVEKEPMKNHISFKVGGPVDLLVIPQTLEAFKKVLSICKKSEFPFYILGKGSNLLVKDKGLRGIMIKTQALTKVLRQDEKLISQPGISLKELANIALEENLTGLEFASGIPGSLGGAVFMNAGAYDGEIKKIVDSIEVITKDGSLKIISGEECNFGYRKSILQEQSWVLVGVTLSLHKGDSHQIKEKMLDLNHQRQTKQPLEYPSAGSTFRRPKGYFAGKLVQDAGFRGYRVGGAQVSEKHSGFVINEDNASAADILKLIALIQAGVREQFGVELQREVIVIGD